MSADPVLLPLSRIRCTEEVCPRRVGEVLAMIWQTQAWTHPICIEATVGALLDGHHRFAAAQLLGLTRVPVFIFDYDEVELASWRAEFRPTRQEVLDRAINGTLYPRKTTRHAFAMRAIRPVPLADLYDGTSRRRDGARPPFASTRHTDLSRETRGERFGG